MTQWKPVANLPPDTYVLMKFADGSNTDSESPNAAVGKLYSDGDIWLTCQWAGTRPHDNPVGWCELPDAAASPGNWQETVNELQRLEAENAAKDAEIVKLRDLVAAIEAAYDSHALLAKEQQEYERAQIATLREALWKIERNDDAAYSRDLAAAALKKAALEPSR